MIWSSLVNAAGHVFYVLGLVLQPAMIMVGLHTGFNFTPNSSTQLTAKCAFLEETKIVNLYTNEIRQYILISITTFVLKFPPFFCLF